ncbi:hypothetical protein SORBI_3009G236150 [Sorghum bicolor]|uniref:Uncharacterized protein n=1 Tax=Sorghum bicolor TaxID=4558 RepID=A0A1Z5R4S5_SORBI|nr:hypothetical protein SORBI_3009G236150 [Sorghum bicolor]
MLGKAGDRDGLPNRNPLFHRDATGKESLGRPCKESEKDSRLRVRDRESGIRFRAQPGPRARACVPARPPVSTRHSRTPTRRPGHQSPVHGRSAAAASAGLRTDRRGRAAGVHVSVSDAGTRAPDQEGFWLSAHLSVLVLFCRGDREACVGGCGIGGLAGGRSRSSQRNVGAGAAKVTVTARDDNEGERGRMDRGRDPPPGPASPWAVGRRHGDHGEWRQPDRRPAGRRAEEKRGPNCFAWSTGGGEGASPSRRVPCAMAFREHPFGSFSPPTGSFRPPPGRPARPHVRHVSRRWLDCLFAPAIR